MADFLQSYSLELQTIGPVHIGSGMKYTKKEYIYLEQERIVLIPDLMKLYEGMRKRRLEKDFSEYILSGPGGLPLANWLYKHNIKKQEFAPWIQYSLKGGDALSQRGKTIDVAACVKDAYNQPYVPGSSIKGMLRTILLAYELIKDRDKFGGFRQQINSAVGEYSGKKCLLRQRNEIETAVFNNLHRMDAKGKQIQASNAVNDCLSGLIVSDSEPLPLSTLVLCQKVDVNREGERNELPILKESICPGTRIHFRLTIDSSICPYTLQDIQEAIRIFDEAYYEMFLSKFSNTDMPDGSTVWLGGGAGFFTKTIVYPLFGHESGVRLASKIFQQTLPRKVQEQHGHQSDVRRGVSPHTIKCTYYQGRILHMGKCKLRVL